MVVVVVDPALLSETESVERRPTTRCDYSACAVALVASQPAIQEKLLKLKISATNKRWKSAARFTGDDAEEEEELCSGAYSGRQEEIPRHRFYADPSADP